MKKLILLLFVLLVGVLPAAAIDMGSGPQAAAAYFPADTKLFFSMRTDEAFLDELEMLVSSVRTQLPAEVPMMGLRETLRQGMATAPVDFDTLMTWLGDWAAFGANEFDSEGGNTQGYLVVALEDQAALEAYLSENSEMFTTGTDAAGNTTYTAGDTLMVLGDGVLYSSSASYEMPEFPVADTLLDSEAYQNSVGALIADQYNAVVYVDLAAAAASANTAEIDELGFDASTLGSAAVGFTILDGDTLTIDTAQTDVTDEAAPVDMNFAQFIPANASAVIHATNFTGLFAQLEALVQATNTNPEDPMEQIRQGLQMFSIDLDEDILSWTTGDYALFMRSDIMGVVTAMESPGQPMDPMQYLDFGLVFEATDAAKAQELASKLNTTIMMAVGQNPEVTVSTEDLRGTEVTVISAPVQPGVVVDLVIGANDNIFFIANRAAADTILSGDGTLASNPTYQEASSYFLPNPSSVWFADANGLAAVTVVPLALLGPAIGNVFDNITDELQNPPSSQTQPQAFNVSNSNQVGQPEVEILTQVMGLINGGTATSTISNGTRLIRITLSLNLE